MSVQGAERVCCRKGQVRPEVSLMRLTIRLLGAEILHVSTEPEQSEGPGDCTTSPVGFAPTPTLPVREPGWDAGVE